MQFQTVNGTLIDIPADFCEECGEVFELEYLTADGLRCPHCDPYGRDREGTAADSA